MIIESLHYKDSFISLMQSCIVFSIVANKSYFSVAELEKYNFAVKYNYIQLSSMSGWDKDLH